MRVNEECGIPVFVSEFAYPSRRMDPAAEFASWTKSVRGYPLSPTGQAALARDLVQWGAENGVTGIRPWAPDFLGEWGPMSLFDHDAVSRIATAKPAVGVFAP